MSLGGNFPEVLNRSISSPGHPRDQTRRQHNAGGTATRRFVRHLRAVTRLCPARDVIAVFCNRPRLPSHRQAPEQYHRSSNRPMPFMKCQLICKRESRITDASILLEEPMEKFGKTTRYSIEHQLSQLHQLVDMASLICKGFSSSGLEHRVKMINGCILHRR